jgi:prephenate dehydrogenase
MLPATLGVIGLGGVGGAVAMRAAHAGIPQILGYDVSTRDGVAAVRAGAITELVHDPASVLRRSEFVVLAVPLRAGVKLLEAHGDLVANERAICTDVAGLKRPIAAMAERLRLENRFAGSHPVVEAAERRFGSVRPERLEGAVVYVTPIEGGERAAAEVGDFWARAVGAHPVTTSPDRHDEVVAWSHHLPLAASAAVSLALARGGPSGVTFGPRAIDVTKLALEDAEESTRALLNNRENVLAVLDALHETAADLRAAVADGDVRAVRAWLGDAMAWREKYER